jgi:UrcA family protein
MRNGKLLQSSFLMCAVMGAAALVTTDALADETATSVTVHYAGLDLSKPAGTRVLYRRIVGAARMVCGEQGRSLEEQLDWQRCYHRAIDDAVVRVNNPRLTALDPDLRRKAATPLIVRLRE